MNGDSYAAIVIALCCIGAAGMASTTLASSLQQDPDDVIDVDYEKLPIGTDEGASVKRAVQGDSSNPDSTGSDSDETDESGPQSSGESNSQERDADSETSQSDESSQSGGDGGETRSAGGADGSGDAGGLSLLDRLVLLLEQLLPLLALLVALALGYRYRRYLLALGLAAAASLRDEAEERSGAESRWPTERPSNEIHRVWLSMIDRLDLDRPRSRTPSECAAAAIDAGLDPTAVRTLTDVFEEVRYGEKPVTEERRRRAREGLERLERGESA